MDHFSNLMPRSFLGIAVTVAVRYFILALIAFLVFYVVRRKAWRYKKIRHAFPKLNDYLREIGSSAITILIFALVGYMVFFTSFRSYTQVYNNISAHSTTYFIFSVLLSFIVHDTYFYWVHRLMHHPAVFRFVHKVHHLSTNPSPWAALAFHPVEAVLEAAIIVVIAVLFPVHPFALAIFLILMMAYNVYGHLGYELYPRGFSKTRIGKWINTSISHNQHHHFFKGNYGLYFLWWDRWMGTLRHDYEDAYELVKSARQPKLSP